MIRLSASLLLFAVAVPAAAQSLPALGERPITRAEVERAVKAQFASMDANHDGVVTRGEFEAFRAHQPPRPEGAPPTFNHLGAHWFDKADTNGDGHVTLAESEARAMGVFDQADLNHDGTVGLDEQRMAMAMMSLGGK